MTVLDRIKHPALLAHVSGIPVRADYRWFFVVALMSGITAASVQWLVGSLLGSLALGFAATIVFFGSIFLHEFAHAMAARLEKLDVVEIVLHPFGGLTRFRHPPETARAVLVKACRQPDYAALLQALAEARHGVAAVWAELFGENLEIES